jgi:hypothetical protein
MADGSRLLPELSSASAPLKHATHAGARWRIDRKIPIPIWIAVGGIGIIATLLGEALLINAVAAYQHPLAQYLVDHAGIDEAQFKALRPVPPPSEWAFREGTFGNSSLTAGMLLAAIAAVVRLLKVRLRWLLVRALTTLLLTVCTAVTLVKVLPHNALNFFYVNSTECVEGCFYIPQPINGWLDTVAIAFIVGLLLCVLLGVVAVARSLPGIRSKTTQR